MGRVGRETCVQAGAALTALLPSAPSWVGVCRDARTAVGLGCLRAVAMEKEEWGGPGSRASLLPAEPRRSCIGTPC